MRDLDASTNDIALSRPIDFAKQPDEQGTALREEDD
jgi:hypothetical protein